MAASLGACHNPTGGDGPPGTTGTSPNCTLIPPTPPPCTQTVVESGSVAAKARTLYFFDFPVPDSGRLDITMDWTNPASSVGP